MFLAYLGPETMLPMTSVVAGVVGFLMMFGRKMVAMVVGIFRRKPTPVAPRTRARGHRPTTSRTMTPTARRAADAQESADSVNV